MDTKLEVVVLPVSDVDKTKAFYRALGWREDGDFSSGDRFRIVQMTPPGSPTSVLFGKGVTDAAPGSVQDLVLAVDDIDAARAELVAQGAEVGDVWHDADGVFYHGGGRNRVPGADPQRRTYSSFATFSDPDGNGFVLQEVTTRLPGRAVVGLRGGRRRSRRPAARRRGAPRAVRAHRTQARLGELVRAVHRRPPARAHARTRRTARPPPLSRPR